MLGPTIEELAQQYKNNPQVKIIKVDTEHPANLELAMKYQINSIPNVQIFK
jgi:thioredoxin-like negative regulator of GroEL